MYTVTIEHIAPCRIVALQHRGPYMEISSKFEKLNAWAASHGLLGTHSRSFGIYYDDPSAVPAAALRSEACLSIPENFKPDGEYRAMETPSGRCARLLFIGPYSELEKPYDWLYGTWLPKSGEELADQPCFEEYLNDPRDVPASELRTIIYVPLKG